MKSAGKFIGAIAFMAWAAVCSNDVVAGEKPLKVHMISASAEYKSEPSLKEFKDFLEKNYNVEVTASWGKDSGKILDNLDALKSADLLVLFARRMNLPEDQMSIIRSHWESGKPIVGIRTAGHAFGKDNEHFDKKVLGGHYKGHYGQEPIAVSATKEGAGHPVLKGVGEFKSRRLYSAGSLADDTVVLQIGDIGKAKHPVTIVHTYKGGKIFFTSLGVPEDFTDANFRKMLTNAIFWTTDRDEAKVKK